MSAATGVQAAITTALRHPPGQGADGAPKGLVDILMQPPPPSGTDQVVDQLAGHGWWLVTAVLLGILLFATGIGLWRYRRVLSFRWRLRRLARHLQADAPDRPTETLAAALMWAVARYLGCSTALDRRRLPERWHALVVRLDAIRFSRPQPSPAPGADSDALRALVQEIRAMPLRGRESC